MCFDNIPGCRYRNIFLSSTLVYGLFFDEASQMIATRTTFQHNSSTQPQLLSIMKWHAHLGKKYSPRFLCLLLHPIVHLISCSLWKSITSLGNKDTTNVNSITREKERNVNSYYSFLTNTDSSINSVSKLGCRNVEEAHLSFLHSFCKF